MPAAIVEIKAALRARIAASGRTVDDVVAEIEDRIRAEIADIKATRARGEEVWPVIDYADIEAGTVAPELLALLQAARLRGGPRSLRPREQAEAVGPRRRRLRRVEPVLRELHRPGRRLLRQPCEMSKPEIYPIYWSSAQMEARQHPRMAAVQSFLNRQWISESEGRRWFDPDRDTHLPGPDPPPPAGRDSGGLGTHLDPGTLDLWMTEGYQQHFRHLFDGDVAAYDPWDAAYRTEAAQYPGSTMCSAFRTFQGWTALSARCATTRACCTPCRSRRPWPT